MERVLRVLLRLVASFLAIVLESDGVGEKERLFICLALWALETIAILPKVM